MGQHPKIQWFKKAGWFYLPQSWQGWAVIVLFLIFCVHIFRAIDAHSHSASDTLYGIFPYIVPAFLLYLWIGSEKS